MDWPVSIPIMPVEFGFWNHRRWTVVLSISNKLAIYSCSTTAIRGPALHRILYHAYAYSATTCTLVGTYSTPDSLLSYLFMGTPYFCVLIGKFNLVFIRRLIFATTLFVHSSVEPTTVRNTTFLEWHQPYVECTQFSSGTSSPSINVLQGTEWSILVTLLITMALSYVLRKYGLEIWKCQFSD